MWECLQNQETALTVTGDLIIGFLPPTYTWMFQRCYICVPARPAWFTKTYSVPRLRWPKIRKIKPWFILLINLPVCSWARCWFSGITAQALLRGKSTSARLNVLLLFWDLNTSLPLNIPLFSNNAIHSQRSHLQATLTNQLTQKWIFALWKVKRPEEPPCQRCWPLIRRKVNLITTPQPRWGAKPHRWGQRGVNASVWVWINGSLTAYEAAKAASVCSLMDTDQYGSWGGQISGVLAAQQVQCATVMTLL